jgi:O-antigen ligase
LASVLAILFTVLRLFALWDEPPELGGLDGVVSLLVSLVIFLSMAVPRWDKDLAQRVMAFLSLAASTAAGIFWWLSRGYSAIAGSDAIGTEFVAQGINRNDFGFVVASATVLAFMFARLSQHRPVRRLSWTVVAVFDLAFLVTLGSRTSLALALLGVVVDLVLERPHYAWWVAGVSTVLMALLPRWLAWIASMGAAAPETLRRGAALVIAFMSGDAGQMAIASAGRTPIWQAGLAAFVRSPIWGTGPGGLRSSVLQSTGSYDYAHSTLIMLLAESGLVGAILFYACCSVVVARLVRFLRQGGSTERHIAAVLLAYVLAVLLLSPFATTGLDKNAWMLLGLGASLGNRRDCATAVWQTFKLSLKGTRGRSWMRTEGKSS